MKENKAVLLGFGLIAFVMLAVVAYAWFVVAKTMHPTNAHMDNPISKAFDSAPFEGNGPIRQVPEVEALLPLGMPAAEVIGKFTADEFKCSREPRETTCTRRIAGASASDEWSVSMTFDTADHLVSRSATRRGTSL